LCSKASVLFGSISKDLSKAFSASPYLAEQFMRSLVRKYGTHPVSTDGGGTWYPQACKFLKLKHHIHLPYEKNIIEKTI
jgi:putative transposase